MRISDLIPSRNFLITRDYWNKENHIVPRISSHPFGDPRAGKYRDQQNGQPRDQRANQYGNQQPDQYGNAQADQYGNQNQRPDQYSSAQVDQLGNQNQRPDQYSSAQVDQLGNQNQRPDQYSSAQADQSAPPPPIITTIGRNNAEINWDYALIERLDERDLSTRLIPFNLAGAIDNSTSPDNQLLKAGDVVTILSRADLTLPMEKHATFILIGGEVNAPGVYRVNPGATLRDVVKQAGGLTSHSYLYASILTRVSAREAQEKQLQQSTEQMQRELTSKFANSTPQAGQTGVDQQTQLAMQQAALAKLASVKPIGRVVLDMKPGAATMADIPDFPLEDGDVFYIPPRLSTVQVAGAVYNTNAFRHQPGKRLVAYLNDAGGATREADQKRIFVIRADGTVVSRQSKNNHFSGDFGKLRLLPGDAIIVPDKIRVSSKMNEFLQGTQLASQLALTAAALNILK
jgi:protein involved in polysaccharide export with SLBB domain